MTDQRRRGTDSNPGWGPLILWTTYGALIVWAVWAFFKIIL